VETIEPASPASPGIFRSVASRWTARIATVPAGIRNSCAKAPVQKEAILPEDLIAMLETPRPRHRRWRATGELPLRLANATRDNRIAGWRSLLPLGRSRYSPTTMIFSDMTLSAQIRFKRL
jgi:hypothetical protein